VRRGPSGKVPCSVCKKWLPKSEAVTLNGRPMHVIRCFGSAMAMVSSAIETAFELGRKQGAKEGADEVFDNLSNQLGVAVPR
jgi:hypothetical protein